MKVIYLLLFVIITACSSNKDHTDVDLHKDSLMQQDFKQIKDDVQQLKEDVRILQEKDSINSRI